MVELKIDNCNHCPFRDHSGVHTPGGAKPVCNHARAVDVRGINKREPYHWKHRVLRKDGKIPEWCPIKLINEGVVIIPMHIRLKREEDFQ